MNNHFFKKKRKNIFPSLDLFSFFIMWRLCVAGATTSLTLSLHDPLLGQDLENVMWITQRGAMTGCKLHSFSYGRMGQCEVSCP